MQTSSPPGAARIAGVLQAEYGLQRVRLLAMLQGADRDSILFRAQEATWFHEAYGPQQPDPQAMAYCRCERIVADVVDYCEQLGGADSVQVRPAALAELQRQLAPGPELQIARSTVAALLSA